MTIAAARSVLCALVFALAGAACSGGSSGSPSAGAAATAPANAGQPPSADARLQLPAGFHANVIANVPAARELAPLPNGDLLVGTGGRTVAIVPQADGTGAAGNAQTFISLPEGPAHGLAYAPNGSVYVATNTTIWRIPYTPGALTAGAPVAIAHVRTGPVAPNSDGDVHVTTSIAVSATTVYAGVGSSCNACAETDPTRATIQAMGLDGSAPRRLAHRWRNPIALALNPATGSLWAGGAGQDALPYGHPYEFADSPTQRGSSDVDYGWPDCEENRVPYDPLHLVPVPSCASTVAPALVFPAYSTLIGAAFYPANAGGAYVFPAPYRGALFVTAHGSWHCCPATPPRVYYVPMASDAPATPVDWSDPSVQSRQFMWGFGNAASASYIGRPAGIAVGVNGSLFVSDDATGNIYRVRSQ